MSPKGLQYLGPAQIQCPGVPNWEGSWGGVPIPAPLVVSEISFPFPDEQVFLRGKGCGCSLSLSFPVLRPLPVSGGDI